MRSAILLLALGAGLASAQADDLTLACLDVGRAVEACEASARRFAEASGNTVRVVAADPMGRSALDGYRALFDVASDRLDVLQFADGWVPALGQDLATLPEPDAAAAIPAALAGGRDNGRRVAVPQHMAVIIARPTDGQQLLDDLVAGPADGVASLESGSAGPTLFPLFLDRLYTFGKDELDDRPTVLAALRLLNDPAGLFRPPAVAAAGPGQTATDLPPDAAASARAAAAQSDALTDGSDPAANFARAAGSAADAASGGDTNEIASGTGKAGGTVAEPLTISRADRIFVSVWYVAVSRHSRHPETAAALAAFLVSEDEMRRAALDFGLAPARPELYAQPAVAAIGPAFARIGAELSRLAPPPVTRYGVAYLDLADDVAEALRIMLRGEADPDATANAIARAARRASQTMN